MTSGWSRPAAHAGSGSRPDDMRRANRTALLRALHLRGATTRAALGASLGLNRSTIKAVVDELTVDGLCTESLPTDRAGAGRPSKVVTPVPTAVWVVAAEIEVGWLTVTGIGLGGTVVGSRGAGPVAGDVDPAELVGRIGDAVDGLVTEVGSRPHALGVAVPGLVRAVDGTVRRAPNLGWSEVPLGGLLADRTGLPVLVRNEADLGALAEHLRGCAQQVADVVYLLVDVGVGGGVLAGGVTLAGSGGHAGEVGHMVVRRDGRSCRCGSRGCWETEVGEEALLRALGLPPGATREELRGRLTALRTGRAPAPAGLPEYGEWLALGLGNLVNLLDPELVVFGGLLAQALPLVRAQLEEHLRVACLLDRPRDVVRLAPSVLGAAGPALGAAEMAFGAVLDAAHSTPGAPDPD